MAFQDQWQEAETPLERAEQANIEIYNNDHSCKVHNPKAVMSYIEAAKLRNITNFDNSGVSPPEIG